jgi:hypothetical protein
MNHETGSGNGLEISRTNLSKEEAHGSVVVKALSYKSVDRGF